MRKEVGKCSPAYREMARRGELILEQYRIHLRELEESGGDTAHARVMVARLEIALKTMDQLQDLFEGAKV